MRSLTRITVLLVLSALTLGSVGCDSYRTSRHRLVGWQAYEKQQYDTAYDRFGQAAKIDSTDWVSVYYLGLIELYQRDNPAEARRRLEIAGALRDAYPDAQFGGEVEQHHGVADRPTRAQLTDHLAEAMFRQGAHRQLAAYLRDTADNEGDTEDYLRLAKYLHKLRDPDAARLVYLQTLKIADTDDAEPYVLFAGFYDAVGDRDEALRRLRQAYFLAPRDKGIAEALRAHGMVPGPTIALPPDRR